MLFQNKNLNFKRLVSKKKTCFPRNNKCWSELGLLVPQIVDRIFLYNILSIIGYLVRSLTTNDIRTPFSSEIDSDRLRSTQSEQEHRRGMPVVTWRVNATYIFSFRLNSLVFFYINYVFFIHRVVLKRDTKFLTTKWIN